MIIVSLDLFLLGLRGGSPHYPLSISYCSYIYRHLCIIIIPEINNYEKKKIIYEQNPAVVALHRGLRPMSAQCYQELVGEGHAYVANLRVGLGIPSPCLRDAAQVGPLPADPSSPADMV